MNGVAIKELIDVVQATRQQPTTWMRVTVAILACVASVAFAQGRIFYDGFESGNTNLWLTPGDSNRCQVVTSSIDGIAGPYAGSHMARCNENGAVEWNDPARTENLSLNTSNRTNELFLRVRMRLDSNHDRTSGSPRKLFRYFQWTGDSATYCDYYTVVRGNSLGDEGVIGGGAFPTYWGGDSVADSGGWHTWEVYFNFATGTLRSWRDNVLTRNNTGLNMSVCAMSPWDLLSNWSDPHDATNYAYFDEVEIFSDNGSGGVGSMYDGTITQGGGGGDTTPPTTSITTSDPSNISTNALTISGTASDAVGVTACRWRIGSAPSSSTGTACTGTTAWSCDTSGYSGGSNTAYVGCRDAAGNWGSDSVTVNYTPPADTTAPAVTISTADPSNISANALTISGTASDAVGVSGCKWRIGAAPNAGSGTACSGTTSFSCSTSGYSGGSNTAYVGCYDAAGNYGADSIIVNYTSPDTTNPTVSITTSDPSSISTNALTVVGTSSDNIGVVGCKWRVGSAPTSVTGTACTGTTSFSCSTNGYVSGTNSLYVGCYDSSGNFGTDSIVADYTPTSYPVVSSVSCLPTSGTATPGYKTCSYVATGGTVTSQLWSGAGSNCSFSSSTALSPQLTCQYGGRRTICVTIQPGGNQGCTTTNSVAFRVRPPTNLHRTD